MEKKKVLYCFDFFFNYYCLHIISLECLWDAGWSSEVMTERISVGLNSSVRSCVSVFWFAVQSHILACFVSVSYVGGRPGDESKALWRCRRTSCVAAMWFLWVGIWKWHLCLFVPSVQTLHGVLSRMTPLCETYCSHFPSVHFGQDFFFSRHLCVCVCVCFAEYDQCLLWVQKFDFFHFSCVLQKMCPPWRLSLKV